jgi:hypothetical protein
MAAPLPGRGASVYKENNMANIIIVAATIAFLAVNYAGFFALLRINKKPEPSFSMR